jgi:PAS domain S-box-containing protein
VKHEVKEHFYAFAVERKIRSLNYCGAFLPTNKENSEKIPRKQTIAKRTKTEEKLAKSNQRIAEVLESIQDNFYSLDRDWNFVYMNKQAGIQLGKNPKDLIGRNIWKEFPQARATLFEENYREAMDKREIRRFETRGKYVDVWLMVTVFPSLDGISVWLIDLTDRKKAEEELKKSEARFRLIAQAGRIGFFEYNVSKDTAYWSPEHYELLGYEQGSLISWQRWLNGLHPEDKTRVIDNAARLMERGRSEGYVQGNKDEYRFIRSDGSIVWIESDLSLDMVNNETIIRGSIRDISKRKKAEEALRESEEKYRLIVDTAEEGIWVAIPDGKTTFVNKKMADMLGYSVEAVLGKSGLDFLDKVQTEEVFKNRATLNGKGKVRNECKFIKKDGSILWTIANTAPVFDDQGKHIANVAMHIDNTERKKAELNLKQRTEELENTQRKLEENAILLEEYSSQMEQLAEQRANQLKDSERLAAIGATAGMVGHDIRNPLQAITSDVYLAKTELATTPDSEGKKNALESLVEIEKNIDYINKIVQDLQDFARPLNPRIEESDFKSIVEAFISKNSLPKNVKVKVRIADEARRIKADPYYLNRILYNLVTNAIQAMPSGGELTIDAHKEADWTVLSVKDTGVGIPWEIRDKMFTLMFTTKSKGQGFGLPVVKRMIESLGGTVAFESTEGKGTTFILRLPPPKT